MCLTVVNKTERFPSNTPLLWEVQGKLSHLWASGAGGQRRLILRHDDVMAEKYQDYFDSLTFPALISWAWQFQCSEVCGVYVSMPVPCITSTQLITGVPVSLSPQHKDLIENRSSAIPHLSSSAPISCSDSHGFQLHTFSPCSAQLFCQSDAV